MVLRSSVTEDGGVNMDIVVLSHQATKLDPIFVSRWLVSAAQTLALTSQLLSNGGVYIHPETKTEPAHRGAVYSTMDPYCSAVLADLDFVVWWFHVVPWERV
jgi:hypothetical protein